MKRALGFAIVLTVLALGSTNFVAAAPGDGVQQFHLQLRLGEWIDQIAQWMGPGPGDCPNNGDCDQDRDRDRTRTRDRTHVPGDYPIQDRDRDRDRDRLRDPGVLDRTVWGPRDGSGDCPYGN